ncbi:MAG: UbiD family decarboxylase [Chloroflexi bacterium]|nr:UbiD family decarboxylase [Chloroflexota bacterium]
MEGNVFGDLREFIAYLKGRGELQEIEAPVDKSWEVGTICRENFDRQGPALVFKRVGDFSTPLVVGVLGTVKRYAMALGVPVDMRAIAQKWEEAYRGPIKPIKVGNAPCKEVRMERVNLWADPFPIPLWHHLDGGPFLGTFHVIVTKDPETGWLNCGTYRNQIFTGDKLGCTILPSRHIGQHWQKWKDLGKPMPVAIAIGVEPYLNVVSVAAVPAGVDEFDVAGGLKGEPVHVVEAETSDLLIPASAEIIIEGEVPHDEFYPKEGPFGEFWGYMGLAQSNKPIIRVKAVTHRRNPFFQGTYEGRPPNESTVASGIGWSMAMKEHLQKAGIPGIIDVSLLSGGCAAGHAVVTIKKTYTGQVRDVLGHVLGHPNLHCKHCVVVDEDIDPWNLQQVAWAITTRVQAGRDIVIISNGKTSILDPSQVPSRKGWSDLLGIDATKPVEAYEREGEEFPVSCDPPAESLEMVRSRWKEYGFR